jgi:hypothetical protein
VVTGPPAFEVVGPLEGVKLVDSVVVVKPLDPELPGWPFAEPPPINKMAVVTAPSEIATSNALLMTPRDFIVGDISRD